MTKNVRSLVFEQKLQTIIAKEAINLFDKTWRLPKQDISISDNYWLKKFRLDKSKTGKAISNTDKWSKFLKAYIVVRGFGTENRGKIHRIVSDQCLKDPTDAYALASTWKRRHISHNLALSAASKVLFFSRPDCECMIFDSFACHAVEARFGIKINHTKKNRSF